MASETNQASENSAFERLITHRGISLFLPFILGFRSQEGETHPTSDRIILVNPFTQGMVVIEGPSSLDTLMHAFETSGKDGQPPASRASIEAMQSVEIKGDGEEECCVVCLEEWQPGGVAKVMPCEHKFHAECIEKWLGIHGSCPVCRYKMPVDEEHGKGKDGQERRDVWVTFSFNGVRSSQNSPSSDSSESMSSSNPGHDTES